MIRVPRSRGGPATVTEKLHEPFRLNESVATHSASVTPTGNVVPEGGEQATDTLPWPFRISGTEYVTSAPTLVRAETVTGAGQVTSGASATGGGGVGALGVLLHPTPPPVADAPENPYRPAALVLQYVSYLHPMSLCRRGEWSSYTKAIL